MVRILKASHPCPVKAYFWKSLHRLVVQFDEALESECEQRRLVNELSTALNDFIQDSLSQIHVMIVWQTASQIAWWRKYRDNECLLFADVLDEEAVEDAAKAVVIGAKAD